VFGRCKLPIFQISTPLLELWGLISFPRRDNRLITADNRLGYAQAIGYQAITPWKRKG